MIFELPWPATLAVSLTIGFGAVSLPNACADAQIRQTFALSPPQRENLRQIVARDAEAKALLQDGTSLGRHRRGKICRQSARIRFGVRQDLPTDGQSDQRKQAGTGRRSVSHVAHHIFACRAKRNREMAARDRRTGTSFRGAKPGSTKHNWHSKRIKLLGFIGAVTGEKIFSNYAWRGFKIYVGEGLFPDGSSRDFHDRDALAYHRSGLKPLLVMALTAAQLGEDLYHFEAPNGASVKKSVDFLLPYVRGEKTHAEWVNTKVPLDRQRAAAGIAEYQTGRPFEPKQAAELLEMAAFFDPNLKPLVLQLAGARRFASWPMVLGAAMRGAEKSGVK